MNNTVIKVTKRYIIDMLNAILFEQTVNWEGIDQFNQMAIVAQEEDGATKLESRGGFFVHDKLPWALRVLATVEEDTSQRVCYRICTIKDRVVFSKPQKNCLPPTDLVLDYSIADLNLGLADWTSYSFHDNIQNPYSSDVSHVERIFSLLKFLLSSSLHTKDDVDLFSDLVNARESQPPVAGDIHYSAVYKRDE